VDSGLGHMTLKSGIVVTFVSTVYNSTVQSRTDL